MRQAGGDVGHDVREMSGEVAARCGARYGANYGTRCERDIIAARYAARYGALLARASCGDGLDVIKKSARIVGLTCKRVR